MPEEKSVFDAVQIPGWMKVLLGVAGLFVSWKIFPVVELFNLFALIVVVPVCIIGSGWLVASGTAETFQTNWKGLMDKAKEEAVELADGAVSKAKKKAKAS
jgi:hypothetical protein